MRRRGKRQRARILCAGTMLGLATLSGVAWAQVNCNIGIEFYPSGAIKSCNLNGHHRLYALRGQPLTCADGHRLELFPDGKLKSCTLAVTLVFDARHCQAGSRLELDQNGTPTTCESP
jgi:hypothetical protein